MLLLILFIVASMVDGIALQQAIVIYMTLNVAAAACVNVVVAVSAVILKVVVDLVVVVVLLSFWFRMGILIICMMCVFLLDYKKS